MRYCRSELSVAIRQFLSRGETAFWATIVVQQTLISLTDNPGQFREPPRSGIFRQAWRERLGRSDGMKNLLTMPF
jgi:hypothetical protein